MSIETASPLKSGAAAAAATAHQPPKPTRLNGLDGFRGFFTMFVVLIHMRVDLMICKNSFVYVGYFFTLSGLLVTCSVLQIFEKKGTFDCLEFWKRRVARIIPQAYLVLVAIACSVVISVVFFPTELTGIDVYWLRQNMIWAVFYGSNWQFIQQGDNYFALSDKIPILRHFWSLSIEEQYYIVWPVLFSVWLYVMMPVIKFFSERFGGQEAITTEEDRQRKEYRYALYALMVGEVVVFTASLAYQFHLMSINTPYYVLHYSTLVHLKEFALGGAMAVALKLTPTLKDVMFSSRQYVPQLGFGHRVLIEMALGLICVFILVYPSTLPTEALFHWYFSVGSIELGFAFGVGMVLIALQTQELNGRQHEHIHVLSCFPGVLRLQSDVLHGCGFVCNILVAFAYIGVAQSS